MSFDKTAFGSNLGTKFDTFWLPFWLHFELKISSQINAKFRQLWTPPAGLPGVPVAP